MSETGTPRLFQLGSVQLAATAAPLLLRPPSPRPLPRLRHPAGTLPTPLGRASGPRPGAQPRAGRVSLALKRALDVVLAAAALLLLSPLLLAILLLVKADGGPALYGHRRLGRGRHPFPCLKFRTMVVDAEARLQRLLADDPQAAAEWAERQKLSNDPRVTPIGAVLRRTSLDELPQLLNVLRGDMSLVGPRPITETEVPRYAAAIDEYCSVRPGITGLWQVSGRSDTSYAHRVALDVRYVRSWSLRRDVKIMLQTVPAVLLRRGAI